MKKNTLFPFISASAILFIGGACFGYFIVFPIAFRYFLGFAKKNMGSLQHLFGGKINFSIGKPFELRPNLMMGEYISLIWKLLIAFGLVFELPVILLTLTLLRVVTYQMLWRFNRYFIILAFVIGAILTPGPDILSQVFMSVPLIVLYNISIILAYFMMRNSEGNKPPLDN